MLDSKNIAGFQEALWGYYAHAARAHLPWRVPEPDGSFDPYKILVSEIMLQQTQAGRVIPKYEAFIGTFPTVQKLAEAELGTVLERWQGLGYNRRAKYLWEAANSIAAKGWPDDLTTLPGVGVNTAGAVRAYAFNEPVIFIETNIRTVLIHTFFNEASTVDDRLVKEVLSEVIDVEHPREFYWAMMDYGVHLKATEGNASRRSKHYKKQSAFIGSNREVRGKVIRELLLGAKSRASLGEIIKDNRLDTVLNTLEQEGLVTQSGDVYRIPNR